MRSVTRGRSAAENCALAIVSSHCFSFLSRPSLARSSASNLASSFSTSTSPTKGSAFLAEVPLLLLCPFRVWMVAWLTVILPRLTAKFVSVPRRGLRPACASDCLHAHDGAVVALLAELHDAFGELRRGGGGRLIRSYPRGELLDLADERNVVLLESFELLLLQLEQLEPLSVDGVRQLLFFARRILQALLVQPQRVRIGLDANFD